MWGWKDVPHLSEQDKADLYGSIPPYQRKARSEGIPMLGSGAIYPIGEEMISCRPFAIPKKWPRAYGMDVGWNWTAVIWGAYDKLGDILYLYSEHKRGEAEPAIHAASIKSRGPWIPGAIDPASKGRSQLDGRKLLDEYRSKALALDLHLADNAVESGLMAVWTRLYEGRLVVFDSLGSWFGEFRTYHRDEKGKIPDNLNDHLMDATRYLVKTGIGLAITEEEARVSYFKNKARPQGNAADQSMGY